MELPEFAPVCPPGIHGELASFFVDCGWTWGDELLRETVALLAAQDIGDLVSLKGLEVDDVEGIEDLPLEAKEFVQKLTRVSVHLCCACHMVLVLMSGWTVHEETNLPRCLCIGDALCHWAKSGEGLEAHASAHHGVERVRRQASAGIANAEAQPA